MTASSTAQPTHQQQVPGILVRLGGWLFRRRTIVPLPIAIVLFAVPPAPSLGGGLVWVGAGLVLAGELVRLVAVRHIGVISRTRSERLGPLVSDGPFGWVRNPLYLGNLLLWIGFTLSARLAWMLAPVAAVLLLEYHAIVRWEESLLESRHGEAYRAYLSRVPRWIPWPPRAGANRSGASVAAFSWRETLFSERGTLMAIAVGYLMLWIKGKVGGG